MKLSCLVAAIVSSLSTFAAAAEFPDSAAFVCGMGEVFVIDVERDGPGQIQKLWSWKGAEREDVPAGLRRQFATTDDCKSVRNGERVLISSSSGGCALVEVSTGRVLWTETVPAAHSIELLPGERIVVAASTAGKGGGDRLVLFNAHAKGEPLWTGPLHSAHGVVWDAERQRLWAIGFDALQEYELAEWDGAKPSLRLAGSFPLPSEGGHDLQPVPGTDDLILSTHDHVELFSRATRTFHRHPTIGDLTHVKSAMIHPSNGRLMCVQASEQQWWTSELRLLNPDVRRSLATEKIYKARWVLTGASERSGSP
ncbi:MAG TPA: DUF6528 family protein [Caulifigura sp.]|nr:DUF6528 family protein [Caulifigura sp.]